MPTYKAMLAWPIGPGGTLHATQGQRVNVYMPDTTTVPVGLTQGGQAVSWVTSDGAGRCEFSTGSANVVDIATPDGSFSRRIESQEQVGAGGGTVADATTTTKGIVQLAGDLAGTADLPTVPALATKAALAHTHAAADVASGTLAVARLGTGTADATKVLKGDGTWGTVSGGGPTVIPASGQWATGPYWYATGSTKPLTRFGTATALWLPGGYPIQAVGINVVTAGTAGDTATIDLYNTGPNGVGSLVSTVATLAVDVGGQISAVVSVALPNPCLLVLTSASSTARIIEGFQYGFANIGPSIANLSTVGASPLPLGGDPGNANRVPGIFVRAA